MNEVVKFELVDIAGVKPSKAVTNVLEEPSQLFLVIDRNEFASRTSLRLVG